MNNVLWLGAHADLGHFLRLKEKLEKRGIILSMPNDPMVTVQLFPQKITEAICAAEVVVLFITDQSLISTGCIREFEYLFSEADNRAKTIIPIVQWGKITFEQANDVDTKHLQKLLLTRQWIVPKDGLYSETDYNQVANAIYNSVYSKITKEKLYENIAGFTKIKYNDGIVLNAAKIIQLLNTDIDVSVIQENKINIYKETVPLLQLIAKSICLGYDDGSRNIAHECMDVIKIIQRVLAEDELKSEDLVRVSIGKSFISFMMDIWYEVMDSLSNGDCHSLGEDTLRKYTEMYDTYEALFQKAAEMYNSAELMKKYSIEDVQIIQIASNCTLNYRVAKEKKCIPEETENNKQLLEIAVCLQKANNLFDAIEDASEQITFLKCLKTSYERLQQYCEIIACLKISATCVEKIAEINQKLEKLSTKTEEPCMEETAFKALLGFKTPVSETYDVFISYKHEDLDIAYSVYHYFNANLLLSFFDKVTLPELGKSEYEEATMSALDRSSHFVVILTSLEQMESHWIKLEMSTFHHEIAEGRKTGSNFILLVTDELYKQIIESNKKCIDIRYRNCEIMRICEFKNSILKYLTTE